MNTMTEQIRSILREHARLSVPVEDVNDETSLYRAGMTSHASVNVMLALEEAFYIEFPDRMLRRSVFETIKGMTRAFEELKESSLIHGA